MFRAFLKQDALNTIFLRPGMGLDVAGYVPLFGPACAPGAKGVQMIAHNTVAASGYGLLDEQTLQPRPNYWVALLWHKLMGTTGLTSDASTSAGAHLYAHCLSDLPGGVALLAINPDRGASKNLNVSAASKRDTLTAQELEGTPVDLK